jgi:hypothetical protein
LRGKGLSLVVRVVAAAVVFVAALGLIAVVAGWERVLDRLPPRLSFWFAVAFAAEAAAFGGYVAYGAVAYLEDRPRLSLREAVGLVAVGFGAFLAKGGASLDSKVLSQGGGEEGEVRVLALDALEDALLAPPACAAAITLLAEGKRASRDSVSRFPGRRLCRWAPSPRCTGCATASASSTARAGAAGSAAC